MSLCPCGAIRVRYRPQVACTRDFLCCNRSYVILSLCRRVFASVLDVCSHSPGFLQNCSNHFFSHPVFLGHVWKYHSVFDLLVYKVAFECLAGVFTSTIGVKYAHLVTSHFSNELFEFLKRFTFCQRKVDLADMGESSMKLTMYAFPPADRVCMGPHTSEYTTSNLEVWISPTGFGV